MKIYLAGEGTKQKIMNIHLAGEHPVKNGTQCKTWKGCNILESFYYVSKNIHFERLYTQCDHFLLDSGAFTFLIGNHKETINWGEYTQKYAEFINRYNIQLFFELDIDSIVGIEKVEYYRNMLEGLTGKKPIPVWHKSRGKQYFIDMCKSYPYVALGGIALKEIPLRLYESLFPWFIKTAHQYGAKIHGLGYTSVNGLFKYHFDSVDSTAWLYGNKGGYLYRFNPFIKTMEQIKKPLNSRLKPHESAMNNFKEWVKFSQYAEQNL